MKKLLSFLSMIFMVFTTFAQICPDDRHPHAIDLGLPSGTKWACCNVGADNPEGYGGYYAWGETEEKEAYNEVSYQYCTGENPNDYGWYEHTQYQDIGSDIAGTQYDVAHVKWGGSWVMPSIDEIKELYNNCTYSLVSLNGVNGLLFISKINSAYLFLPAADLHYPGDIGQYWSSSQEPSNLKWAYGLYLLSDDTNWTYFARAVGLTVRPVIKGTYAQICPDENHPHIIDLGLPSGTKWACCNVGTDKPEGYGGYYAWGETEEKTFYDWSTYTHCDGSESTCHNLGSDIAGTQYDVAHVIWGDSWVMPTKDQQMELLNYSTCQWITKNGVNGRTFTGLNGGTIFLPAAGIYWFDEISNAGINGEYWSSTQGASSSHNACGMDAGSGGKIRFEGIRDIGRSVRPVFSETNSINLPKSFSDKSSQAIYNLYGIKVADTIADMNTLPPGIYIVKGKKIVIK